MLVNVQYPDVVLNVKDVKASIDAGDKMSDLVDKHLTELDNNITIMDSEESGIARREKILGIKPLDTSSLEDRRLEVLIRWYDTPIYTEVTLRQKLDSVLGKGNYVLTIDLDAKQVKCQIELTRQMMFKSVQELFEQMVPLDYLIDVTLRYNQHITLAKYTHAQLAKRTHFALRNEALDADAKAREEFGSRMGETQNYSLKKPAPEDFYNVEDFNGNFDIIDQELQLLKENQGSGVTDEEIKKIKEEIEKLKLEKANKPKTLNVTIHSASWIGTKAPYTATITVDALTGAETEYVEVFVPYEATTEQKTAWAEAGVASGDNKAKQLILEALGDKPGIDIPITLIVREE